MFGMINIILKIKYILYILYDCVDFTYIIIAMIFLHQYMYI